MFTNTDFTFLNLAWVGGLWLIAIFVVAGFFSVTVAKVLDSKSPKKSRILAVPGALLTIAVAAGSSFYNFNSVYGFVTGENATYTFGSVLLIGLHSLLFLSSIFLVFSALKFFLVSAFKSDKTEKKLNKPAANTPAVNKPANKTVAKTDAEFDADIEAQLKAMRL